MYVRITSSYIPFDKPEDYIANYRSMADNDLLANAAAMKLNPQAFSDVMEFALYTVLTERFKIVTLNNQRKEFGEQKS